ncbi:Ebp2-domain-containing protein [Trichodelitschia bisporula]|uniref:Ebp2-domain-containing protein n=1 Tax=Trichodelitschia bisporula TaxID=703511 RepID=A0A6G1HSC2_9PEZI|nr:Ebp2-domain-containing protein [Trichodelitschia bisporula]
MGKPKLKAALENLKGVDHKLEKQKKLRKKAEKEKKVKLQQKGGLEPEEGDDAETGGVALEPKKSVKGKKNGEKAPEKPAEDEQWETESEEDDDKPRYDLSRLDDSDTSGDDEDFADEDGAPDAEEEEDEDDEEEQEDIALSDIESLASEDKGDIVPYQRLTINNTAALLAAHKRIALPLSKLPFSAHHSVITAEPVQIADIDDDLNRELAFYAQSLSAVRKARALLKSEGAPFARPVDYFAEMVKSDEHMGKVKARLIEDAARKKASAEARRQRDLKKFGKQVQVAKQQERDKAKRETVEKINILKRKRAGAAITAENEPDQFDVEIEDAAVTHRKDRDERKKGGPDRSGKSNPKRRKKDEKFGFGGKKRHNKSGDAESSADFRGFSHAKMKGKPLGGAKKGGQRPGKARRQKAF